MAYKINRTGDNVSELLTEVDDKTIYPLATKRNDGLMPMSQVEKIEELDTGVLSDEEIRMICV